MEEITCKCGKKTSTTFGIFCSPECQEASKKREFRTYSVRCSLICSSPSELEIVKRMIDLTREMKERKISFNFLDIHELDFKLTKSREIDLNKNINIILTNKNRTHEN